MGGNIMSRVIIPAKKVMEPGMNLNDIEYIWDYIDMRVEEEIPNVPEPCFDYEDDVDDEYYNYDDSWGDYDGPYMSDKDWDYYDAFEGDPEAVWGREW